MIELRWIIGKARPLGSFRVEGDTWAHLQYREREVIGGVIQRGYEHEWTDVPTVSEPQTGRE